MSVTRRFALVATTAAAAAAGLPRQAAAATQSFEAFLDGVRADARRAGISNATVQRARYMTLETIATLGDDRAVSLPPMAA